MSIFTEAVPFFRTQYAAALADICTIRRGTGRGTFNTGTGAYDAPPAPTVVYTGACLARPSSSEALQEDRGQEAIQVVPYDIFLPDTVDTVEHDDEVTMDTTLDGQLTGEVLLVVNVVRDSYDARRKLECELNLGGGSQ